MKTSGYRRGPIFPFPLWLFLSAGLSLWILLGCSKRGAKTQASLISFAGVFQTGFERSDFQPCGRQQVWWLKNPGIIFRTHPELRQAARIYLRFRGRQSPPGRYGHLGSYPVEVEIIQLEQASAKIPPDCVERESE